MGVIVPTFAEKALLRRLGSKQTCGVSYAGRRGPSGGSDSVVVDARDLRRHAIPHTLDWSELVLVCQGRRENFPTAWESCLTRPALLLNFSLALLPPLPYRVHLHMNEM